MIDLETAEVWGAPFYHRMGVSCNECDKTSHEYLATGYPESFKFPDFYEWMLQNTAFDRSVNAVLNVVGTSNILVSIRRVLNTQDASLSPVVADVFDGVFRIRTKLVWSGRVLSWDEFCQEVSSAHARYAVVRDVLDE